MKIAVWYNLWSGGAKRALHYHVRGLVERGHQVEVWCPPTADRDYLPLSAFAIEHVVPFDSPDVDWSHSAWSFYDYQRMQAIIAAMDRHCQLCAVEIRQGGFDVLFANTCVLFGAPAIGCWVDLPRALYLQEPHRRLYEAMPELLWLAPTQSLPSKPTPRQRARWVKSRWNDLVTNGSVRLQARQEVTNARAYDALWVNSYFSRESVLRAYGIDAQVCYLGVDLAAFCNHNLPREDFIIGLGAIVTFKNVRFVIEALAALPTPRPRLIWVGNVTSPDYLAELQALAERAQVSFEVRQGISNDELVSLLNRARLMAYAPRLEPFGFAPLEANACGLPVVAAMEGGVRETVQDGVNGLLVDPTPQAMASAIAHLLANPMLAQQLGKNGSRLVSERWALAAAIDRIEARLLALSQAQRGTTARVSSA